MRFNKSVISRTTKYVLVLPILALVFWMAGAQEIISSLTQFPLSSFAIILLLLSGNLWLVGFRFWRVLKHFSIRLSLAEASRASIAGHVAGLVMISLIGQVSGRQAVLRQFGVTPLLNASLAGYERVVLAIVSGVLALVAAMYLLGAHMITAFLNKTPLIEIALLIVVGVVFSVWLGGGYNRKAANWIDRIISWKNLSHAGSIFALTLAGQFLVLLCFVVGVTALYENVPILSVFAAAALISFSASLPITINGWGVRELTSVFVLGKIGVSSADAVAISILIGLSSTAVILLVTPVLFRKPALAISCGGEGGQRTVRATDMERVAAWGLGMAVAATIFFQFHVELTAGTLNLNLADPFALLSLAAVGLGSALMRQPIRWRIAGCSRALLVFTGMLILAFANGWLKIGLTQWAIGGRLIGWLVLMGYLSAGYILISNGGHKWLRRLAETLTAFAVLIILWQVLSRLLFVSGWATGGFLTPNFEGYSGNRNAFAFQLLVVTAMLLALMGSGRIPAYFLTNTRQLRNSFLLGVIIAGVVWTGSRAGLLTEATLLLVIVTWIPVTRKVIIQGMIVAGVLWWCQSEALTLLGGMNGIQHTAGIQSYISGETSNVERWNTWVHAVELWLDSPVIGAGLGTFIAKSPEWLGYPQVIHSTPLWLLTEFGLLGIVVLAWACRSLVIYTFGKSLSSASSSRLALALLLIAFGMFGLVHEIFYQRIFWLALGALLAGPGTAIQSEK